MDLTKIGTTREIIADFCRRHQIRMLSLFGSVLREEFDERSDVDVLVEFQPGTVVGFAIVDIEDDLSRLFGGRKVDLINPKYLNRHLRDRILTSAEVQYKEMQPHV